MTDLFLGRPQYATVKETGTHWSAVYFIAVVALGQKQDKVGWNGGAEGPRTRIAPITGCLPCPTCPNTSYAHQSGVYRRRTAPPPQTPSQPVTAER